MLEPFRATILVTRPEAQANRLAAELAVRFGSDLPVCLSPLMRVVFLDPPSIPPAATLVFTSENAVLGYGRLMPGRRQPAWCVGERTARAARKAGFRVLVGPGDAKGLARHLIAVRPEGPVLYPHGVHVAVDVAAELISAGIETLSLVVYDQLALPPTDQASRLMASSAPVILPLFSPRSAQLVRRSFSDVSAPLLVAALSPKVADEARSLSPRRVEIAARPDLPSLLEALDRLVGGNITG